MSFDSFVVFFFKSGQTLTSEVEHTLQLKMR